MALTLSITDNGDGTGGVATIAGSDAGSTNTVYTMLAGESSWTSRGSRVGNGTLSLSVNSGYYFAYVAGTLVSAAPAVSTVAGLLAITSDTQAVYDKLCDEIVSTIQTAITAGTISGVTVAANVSKMWALDDKAKDFPHVFVTPPRGGQEQQSGGTNLRDDWTKPIQVSLVDRCHEDYTTGFSDATLARERLIRLFANKRLSTVSELAKVTIQPLPIVQFLVDGAYQYRISAFILGNQTREVRTP